MTDTSLPRVRAVRCDHRAQDDAVYAALCRATDPLDGAWERLTRARRITVKFNQARVADPRSSRQGRAARCVRPDGGGRRARQGDVAAAPRGPAGSLAPQVGADRRPGRGGAAIQIRDRRRARPTGWEAMSVVGAGRRPARSPRRNDTSYMAPGGEVPPPGACESHHCRRTRWECWIASHCKVAQRW